MGIPSYEKLGSFYLGRTIDGPDGEPTSEDVLYDARDLTTHAVILGMTGSGKTGLGIGLLEEAAVDGIPSIALDVKGDLTNLLLAFPELGAKDFRPWIDESAAERKGISPDALASSTADLWRNGLATWGQDGERIRRYRSAVDMALYTPGSTSGTPMSLLGSLDAPPAAVRDDTDVMRDRVAGTVSGLLTLLGIDADPVRSREHILLSSILDGEWRAGRSMTLADLIRAVQQPPFTSVGVVDIESFFPGKDRTELAMLLNNLLASPGFQAWREGEPLDVGRLLATADGRPRMSILYIAHLSETERMFFVTRLLNEVVAWMRTQPGTGSLRALLYMDEVFGYFPPSANPPSKRPLMTLMKQARAFGIGVVLATQNPVDLDYKGLSNAGTWMLGRLQTERDKMRVLDGLEGAASGAAFDRAEMDRVLSALGKRRFVLHSVHESGPVLFHTRWVMSYLAGPLTMAQVKTLARQGLGASGQAAPVDAPAGASTPVRSGTASPSGSMPGMDSTRRTAGPERPDATAFEGQRPLVATGIEECFVDLRRYVGPGAEVVYRPSILAGGRVHYVKAGWEIDVWDELSVLAPVGDRPAWEDAERIDPSETGLAGAPEDGAHFEPLPGEAARAASYRTWEGDFKDWLFRGRPLELLRCEALNEVSRPGERESDFRLRIRMAARERRDQEVEKLRARYAAKLDTLARRIRAAEERVTKEEGQYDQQKLSTALNVGSTLLGALLGRRSRSSISGASAAARGMGRAAQERTDVRLAQEKLEAARSELADMELELQSIVDELGSAWDPDRLVIEKTELAARKSDIDVTRMTLAWVPCVRQEDGSVLPVWR